MRTAAFALLLSLAVFSSCKTKTAQPALTETQTPKNNIMNTDNKDLTPVVKSEEEWKNLLSPEQYRVLREKGTEAPFTGKYYLNKEKGV